VVDQTQLREGVRRLDWFVFMFIYAFDFLVFHCFGGIAVVLGFSVGVKE